ncbi:MAG: hypothetical protein ACRD4P_05055, partial [Bryobacteraceae bacterium]
MSDEGMELAKIGFQALFQPFANLAERLFGGAVDEIGAGWKDTFRARRMIREIKLLKNIQKELDDAGIE